MTREQAQREATKRWGKQACIRASESLSSPEKRTAAKAMRDAGKARIEAIDAEIKKRLLELDWYTALLAEKKNLRDKWGQVKGTGDLSYYKFSVGKDVGYAFHVCGSGDTWEEAFAQADGKARTA